MKFWSTMLVAGVALLLAANTAYGQQESTPEPATPRLLSAFFGLDNALPAGAIGLCRFALGQDGMPVIFSHEIEPNTLQANDFAVVTAAGVVHTPVCAVLEPAVDAGEFRTVLLIGEFGNADTDPPARVEVVGEVVSLNLIDGTIQDFIGTSVEVTPLSAGPELVFAESVIPVQLRLDQRAGRQQGDGCPGNRTLQAVRVTWQGGVSNAQGDEAGTLERDQYRVTLTLPDGSETDVIPFALADLGDGDNNHLLCLDVRGEAISVFFPAGYLLDPNRDTLNPDTRITVQPLPLRLPE